jgi:hypothetical protein
MYRQHLLLICVKMHNADATDINKDYSQQVLLCLHERLRVGHNVTYC